MMNRHVLQQLDATAPGIDLHHMRWWMRTLLVAAILCVASSTSFAEDGKNEAKGAKGRGGKPEPAPAKVRVGVVRQQVVQNRRNVVGQFIEVRRVTVASEQEGRVVYVSAEQGDVVRGGETVLAKIDDVWAKLTLAEARAALEQARAEVQEKAARFEQSKRDLAYLEGLLRQGSAKVREVDNARATVAEDQAKLHNTRAQTTAAQITVERTQEQLARLTIVAPFDGVVVRKMTEVGQWLSSGSNVAQIISHGRIDAQVDVPERLVNQLAVGQEIELTVDALRSTPHAEVRGIVAAIVPLGDLSARTFPVKIRLDDQDGRLKSGMSVLAKIPTGERAQHLTVPRDAVLRSARGAVVWANDQGKAMPVRVQVLFGVGDRYVVRPIGGGFALRPGTQVVIEGAERLTFATQPLEVVNASPVPPASPGPPAPRAAKAPPPQRDEGGKKQQAGS